MNNAHPYFLRTLPRLDASVVENRLGRELLGIHPLDKSVVRQPSRPRTPLLHNICSGLVRCPQELGARFVCELVNDNLLKIENCKLIIASKGAFDA